MALYDIKADLSAPAQGTYQSEAGQSQSLNLNPVFAFGSSGITSSPSGASGADVNPSQTTVPSQTNVPFAGGSVGVGAGSVPAAAGAVPLSLSSSGTSSWLLILLIGGAVLLATGGGAKGHR